LSLNRENALFDVLTNCDSPYPGFGQLLHDSQGAESELRRDAAVARMQLRETFNAHLNTSLESLSELDRIVADMWNNGWDPKKGNVNLFARDFGLILVESLIALLGGRLIFRSGNIVTHCSIFWKDAAVEAFPFHKALKCLLLDQHGDSMAYFAKGLAHLVK
jgi:hypothetical protein